MRQSYVLTLTCLMFGVLAGCSKPDSVAVFKSPAVGVFYTVEVFKAIGLASNTTKVYAHFEHDGKAKKVLVLSGDDLTVRNIIWNTPEDVTLCLDGGFTDTFRNEVTLIVGDRLDDSMTITNHLQEHCNATSRTSPNTSH